MQIHNIQPFIIKFGDSINNHPNDNGTYAKLKAIYNISNAKLMVKYVTYSFQPHHMKYVLVETWKAFPLSSGNIIRDCSIPGSFYTARVAPYQSMIGLGPLNKARQTRHSLGLV